MSWELGLLALLAGVLLGAGLVLVLNCPSTGPSPELRTGSGQAPSTGSGQAPSTGSGQVFTRGRGTVRIESATAPPRSHRHVWAKRSEEATNRQRIGVYVCGGCDDRERRVEEELG